MSVANVGLARDQYHRYYWNGDGPIPSVTTITGAVIAKPALVGWARRETAKYAVQNLDLVARMVKDFGVDTTVASVKTVTDKEARDKANLGTRVHAQAEQVIRDKPVVALEDEAPFLTSLAAFLVDWQPEWKAAEEMVCNLTHGYAGTLDAVAIIDGRMTLLDIKTGGELGKSGIYEEFALQLAAYGRAEFFGRPGVPRKFRPFQVTDYAILHLRPEGYSLVPFKVTDDDYEAFLAARRLYAWTVDTAPTVKGEPLERKAVAA